MKVLFIVIEISKHTINTGPAVLKMNSEKSNSQPGTPIDRNNIKLSRYSTESKLSVRPPSKLGGLSMPKNPKSHRPKYWEAQKMNDAVNQTQYLILYDMYVT